MTTSTRRSGGRELLPVPGWVSSMQTALKSSRSTVSSGVSVISSSLAIARFSLRAIIPEKAMVAFLLSFIASRWRSAMAEARQSGSGLSWMMIMVFPVPCSHSSISSDCALERRRRLSIVMVPLNLSSHFMALPSPASWPHQMPRLKLLSLLLIYSRQHDTAIQFHDLTGFRQRHVIQYKNPKKNNGFFSVAAAKTSEASNCLEISRRFILEAHIFKVVTYQVRTCFLNNNSLAFISCF